MSIAKTYDIIIVGAGIIGCSVAYKFATSNCNLKILIIEENGNSFQGSSKAGFGSLTPYSDPFFKGDAMRFASKSLNLFRDTWLPEISDKSNEKISWSNRGLLKLCHEKDSIDKLNEHHLLLTRNGFPSKILKREELKEIEPNISSNIKAALWLDEPWIDLQSYLNSFEIAIKKTKNITRIFNIKFQSVKQNGESISVKTVDQEYSCKKVIISTGLHNNNIFKNLTGVQLVWVRGDAIGITTKNNKPIIEHSLYMNNGFITPRSNGFMLLGATYEIEKYNLEDYHNQITDRVEVQQFQKLINANIKIVPQIKNCEVVKTWRGWRPTTSDRMPLLGELAVSPNIFIANGFIGLGTTMSANVAESLYNLIIEDDNQIPNLFNPNRFISKNLK